MPYAGNIRLDAMDRELGKVHFAFYEDLAEWKDKSAVTHIVLDMTQGVAVEKFDRLLYRIILSRQDGRLCAQRSLSGRAARRHGRI